MWGFSFSTSSPNIRNNDNITDHVLREINQPSRARKIYSLLLLIKNTTVCSDTVLWRVLNVLEVTIFRYHGSETINNTSPSACYIESRDVFSRIRADAVSSQTSSFRSKMKRGISKQGLALKNQLQFEI